MNLSIPQKTILVSDPTLEWCKPRGVVNTVLAKHDNGFVNRLSCLIKAHQYRTLLGNQHTLLVEKAYWPELELLELPNTIAVNKNKEDILKLLNSYPITTDHAEFCEIKEHKHLFTSYPFSLIRKEDNIVFPKIKFRQKFIENVIDCTVTAQEFLGVHVRWGRGVENPILNVRYVDKNGISGITQEDDMLVAKWGPNTVPNEMWNLIEFLPLEYYFKFMDTEVDLYNDRKFYISTDIPTAYIKPFFDRYGDRVYTRDHLIPDFRKKLSASRLVFKGFYTHTLEVVVDFMCMTKCCGYLGPTASSWGRVLEILGLASKDWNYSLRKTTTKLKSSTSNQRLKYLA